MASGDVSSSKLLGPSRTKIIEENIDTVKKMAEEKTQLFHFPSNVYFQFPSRASEHSGKIRCYPQ